MEKCSGWNVLIAIQAVVGDDASGLRERPRPIDEVEDERHRDAVEPSVAERSDSASACRTPTPAGTAFRATSDHLGARVDAPGRRVRPLDERRRRAGPCRSRRRARAAAKVAQLDERVERPPTTGVGPARSSVVDAGARPEVGLAGPLTTPAPARAPFRGPRGHGTRRPRSGNGISTTSKSRGHDGVGEDLTRLLAASLPIVAARDVRKRAERTPAACAASAASAAVECSSPARCRSSAQNVASWTSRSPPPRVDTDAAGAVSR
jgi:hypothetical protein